MEVLESIQRGDVFYTIQQTEDESREVYLDRVNYIIEVLNDNTSITINDAIRNSYIWRNITQYGMSYPSTILRTLNLKSLS
jgi:hypothetical protein